MISQNFAFVVPAGREAHVIRLVKQDFLDQDDVLIVRTTKDGKGEMEMKNEIDEALNAHSAWKQQFKDFLNGRATFDLATVDATDHCRFGTWLDNEGYRMVPSEIHSEIRSVHKEFHQIAAEIIQKIKDERFAEAREDISQNGALNQASLRLTDLLMNLSLRAP